jgi:hypothetical protein
MAPPQTPDGNKHNIDDVRIKEKNAKLDITLD